MIYGQCCLSHYWFHAESDSIQLHSSWVDLTYMSFFLHTRRFLQDSFEFVKNEDRFYKLLTKFHFFSALFCLVAEVFLSPPLYIYIYIYIYLLEKKRSYWYINVYKFFLSLLPTFSRCGYLSSTTPASTSTLINVKCAALVVSALEAIKSPPEWCAMLIHSPICLHPYIFFS